MSKAKIFIWSFVGCVLVGIATVILAVSCLMDSANPKTAFVYTRRSPVPNFVFEISSVPLALASFVKYGFGAFAVRKATAANIENLLNSAEFVIIGTHGRAGKVISDDGIWISYNNMANPNLRLAYFGSCEFGRARSQWQARLPNAKLIGYDGLTTPLTGWIYLVFRAPLDLLGSP